MKIILIILLGISSLLSATIWEIKQDGTGDFISIQEGINAAADGDTVLVHPGTYYENIDFSSKTIVVASLCLTTGDESYKYETIIDGDQNDSCVRITSGEGEGTMICGFTLTNGWGISGGGVRVRDSAVTIRNCIIKDNYAVGGGGGIFAYNCLINLEGNSIYNNRARASGGGLLITSPGGSTISPVNIIWDESNLNSIYLNYGLTGNDIAASVTAIENFHVILDTFTVAELDPYFLLHVNSTGQFSGNTLLSANNTIIEEHVNDDLYVAPDGENSNSGLTLDDPLATLNYALALIKPDSLNNNTVYVADGVYSFNENDNWFPLNLRSYISLEGESMANTILDAEEFPNSRFMYGRLIRYNSHIKKFTMTNGISSGMALVSINDFYNETDIVLENIIIQNSKTNYYGVYTAFVAAFLKNIQYHNNFGGVAISLLDTRPNPQKVHIENSRIHYIRPWEGASGAYGTFSRPMNITGRPFSDIPFQVNLINMELSDSINNNTMSRCAGIAVLNNVKLNIINCTLGDLRGSGIKGAIYVDGTNAEVNIYNSILWNTSTYEMFLDADDTGHPSTVNISHSIIRGGEDGIHDPFSHHTVNWLEGNLDEDPLWVGEGDYPYSLSANSPAINAGTMDLPPGITLPETDLAGNPRIYGDSIDMGAYEWQGVDAEDDMVMKIKQTRISNYPNPFNPDTTIRLELAEAGRIELSIYNIKGQKVRNLLDAHTEPGIFTCNWNGRDDNGRPVSSGQYFIKLKQNDEVTVEKMMMVK